MTWKVVKIIDDYQLVINAGESANLEKGDKLMVYVPGEEILDPDTGESLGTLDTVKCYITVSDVFQKMSVCVNASTTNGDLSNLGKLLSSRPKPLPINPEDISGGLQPATMIKIGDPVRKA